MHRPPIMLSGFRHRHRSYESRFRACCNSRRIAVSRRHRRLKMLDARRSARRCRVSAKVQKVTKLAKYSVKQRKTTASGGGAIPSLRSPWIRHWKGGLNKKNHPILIL